MTPHPLDDEGRCALCRNGLTGFDTAFSYGAYEGTLRKMVQVFKYGNVPVLAGPLGAMLGRAIPRERQFDAIVPMPMHWRRRWERGFNQAALLADVASARLGIPISSAVRRRKATPPQAGLTGAQRRANMSGAFEVRQPAAIQGKRVLLVDDVLTTGATAGACARALKRAGAAQVAVATVARADRRGAPLASLDIVAAGSSSPLVRSVHGQPRSTA
jgi:ComF family protein